MAEQDTEPEVSIQKLYMKGFKSFQRQTAIPFYNGMTAIVGSNGSGKSNIMDALRFVMGRRSSHLRAEKMEQLIFNGGESRKPADEAVVRLHLDNTDGRFDELLDEDDEEDEVVIGRKITRNGYSTYRFQGTNCKRSMIDQVLEKSGVDPGGYHFIKQGRITQVVQETPVQRRETIDEISGIASYEHKKEKALEELETVQERLDNLHIRKTMKEDRLENLREQKEVAEEFQELEDRKQRLKYSILVTRREELQNQMDNLGEDEKLDRIDELEDEVEEIDEELEQLEEEKEDIEQQIQDERDTNIVEEIERIRGKVERKKGKIENKRDRIDDIDSILDEYKNVSSGYRGGRRGVKKVLDQGFDGVHGTVSQLIHYDERFAAAMDAALGAKQHNIVVDSREVATKCVNFLKKVGERATFLPLDKVSPRNKNSSSERAHKMAGVIDYAIDVVDYDSDYDRAIKHVLGDTLIAQDLESLRNAGRIRAVTLDGDIMRKGGSITGGAKKRGKKNKRSSGSSINPEKKKKKKQTLKDEIEDLKQEIGELNRLLEQKEEAEKEKSQVSEELQEKRDELEERLKEKRDERKDVAGELKTLQSKIGKVQTKRARFEAELDNIAEEIEEYDDGIDEVERSLDDLEKKKKKTVKKQNRLGDVNMRAIKEFNEFREEFDEFKEKIRKIREEKTEIEEMIQDLEAEKRERFMRTLEEVSTTFNDIFQQLFNGGEAALELEDEDDIDSGLLIKAHPPDKEPHVIDSLSGGEKTLTAIAFVFALQEFRPSPFYLMDEIDAALDGPNSEQLSELLKSYAEGSQVIFISHNEQTVRHADRAYGVSMRDGVSRIRSIELDE